MKEEKPLNIIIDNERIITAKFHANFGQCISFILESYSDFLKCSLLVFRIFYAKYELEKFLRKNRKKSAKNWRPHILFK